MDCKKVKDMKSDYLKKGFVEKYQPKHGVAGFCRETFKAKLNKLLEQSEKERAINFYVHESNAPTIRSLDRWMFYESIYNEWLDNN